MKKFFIIFVVILIVGALSFFILYKPATKKAQTTNAITPTTPLVSPTNSTTKSTQTNDQAELTLAVNPTHDPVVAVTVQKISGNYATGVIGPADGEGAGAVWYAVKTDGKWKKVWTGQSHISCKVVEQYDIPKEIYYEVCSNDY